MMQWLILCMTSFLTNLLPSKVMVRYKSFLLRIMSTLVFALPLLLGFWEQKQVIDLILFESYYEPYGEGALSALLSVQSHRVQIYSSVLTVEANFSGFT